MHAVDFTGKMISLRQTLARTRWLHCIVLLGKSVENIFLSHKKSSQFIVLNQLYIFSSSQTADVRNNSNKHNGGKRYKKFCCETNSQILGFARLQKKQKEENKMLTPTTLNWYQLFTQQVKRLNHFLSGSILYWRKVRAKIVKWLIVRRMELNNTADILNVIWNHRNRARCWKKSAQILHIWWRFKSNEHKYIMNTNHLAIVNNAVTNTDYILRSHKRDEGSRTVMSDSDHLTLSSVSEVSYSSSLIFINPLLEKSAWLMSSPISSNG